MRYLGCGKLMVDALLKGRVAETRAWLEIVERGQEKTQCGESSQVS